MLRISKLMDYGTVVLTYMAGAPTQVRSASELAEALKLGQATVSKILKTLGQHNIVVSQRGAHGGYRLARPASEITVAQVLDALDDRSEEHTSELQSRGHLVCRLLLEKKNIKE